MPTSTLAEVMDALADQIRSVVAEVTDVDVQVEPRWVSNPTPPTIDIYPSDPSSDPELRGMGDPLGADLVTVRARVDMADPDAGQELLLAFMDDVDPLSIAQAIWENYTLGGIADVDVQSRSGFVRFVENTDLLGCLWGLRIVKARS